MNIFDIFTIYLLIKGTTADIESYDEDLDSLSEENKQAKRCGPGHFISEETSGCRSSEETTTTTLRPTIITTKKPFVIIPKGPFFNFLVNICNSLLTKFSPFGITKYFNVLSKSLRGLGSGHLFKMLLNRFCDKLKKLSDLNGQILRAKVIKFLKILHEGNPVLNEYFFAMNRIYKIWDDNEMDNYIYLLRQYGQGQNLHIGQRTCDIFQGLVFHRLNKQSDKKRDDVDLKFKLAVLEYYHDEI